MIKAAYVKGYNDALAKFALAPPTQVDTFVASVEHGKDVTPEAALPPMSHPPALDGTTLPPPPMGGAMGL